MLQPVPESPPFSWLANIPSCGIVLVRGEMESDPREGRSFKMNQGRKPGGWERTEGSLDHWSRAVVGSVDVFEGHGGERHRL